MFNSTYEDRILIWRNFRLELETSSDPIRDAINFYNAAPLSQLQTDPYDQSSWPSAWELLDYNSYCEFTKILAIYYSLSLLNRFKECVFSLKFMNDHSTSKYFYLLFINDCVVGFENDQAIHVSELPNTLSVSESFNLSTKINH